MPLALHRSGSSLANLSALSAGFVSMLEDVEVYATYDCQFVITGDLNNEDHSFQDTVHLNSLNSMLGSARFKDEAPRGGGCHYKR